MRCGSESRPQPRALLSNFENQPKRALLAEVTDRHAVEAIAAQQPSGPGVAPTDQAWVRRKEIAARSRVITASAKALEGPGSEGPQTDRTSRAHRRHANPFGEACRRVRAGFAGMHSPVTGSRAADGRRMRTGWHSAHLSGTVSTAGVSGARSRNTCHTCQPGCAKSFPDPARLLARYPDSPGSGGRRVLPRGWDMRSSLRCGESGLPAHDFAR
jgi:hypothetical protein